MTLLIESTAIKTSLECLGEIPTHWNFMRLKFLLIKMEQGWSPQCETRTADEEEWAVLKVGCVNGGVFNDAENKALPAELSPRSEYEVRAGDMLMSRANTRELLGSAAVVRTVRPRTLLCDKLYRLVIDTDKLSVDFLARFFSSHPARYQLEKEATGASESMQNISQEAIKECLLPVPPLTEQLAIVRFLDNETARIESLIQMKRRLIELLREQRLALVTQTIGKGLQIGNVKMKDSGVDWLDTIPAHWTLKPLKYLSSLTVGIVVNPSEFISDEGLPFIYGGDIREGVIDTASARRINSAHSDSHIKTKLQGGDLLTVRVGAPGITAVVPPECEGGNCASVMLIKKGKFSSQWLCYAMNSRIVRYQVEVVQYGAAQEQFNISHAVDFLIPSPPLEEQIAIANKLDRETARLDALINKTEQSIALLEERRIALIGAAVTGKLDVHAGVSV